MSVKDFVPAGVLYQINATNSGTFNNATGIWVIGNRAVNQTVTLLISVKALYQGTYFNRAEIWTCNEQDVDSEPANSPLINNQKIAKVVELLPSFSPISQSESYELLSKPYSILHTLNPPRSNYTVRQFAQNVLLRVFFFHFLSANKRVVKSPFGSPHSLDYTQKFL